MRYFVTGHTGFKGAWLCLLLKELGHEVYGYSSEVRLGSLFDRANVAEEIDGHSIGDICHESALLSALKAARPEVVIHMAAQSLVSKGFENPFETFRVNSEGTRVTLQACSQVETVNRVLVVTTDKVYRDKETRSGHTELDPLGGSDPYSASKAAADIIATSIASVLPSARMKVLVARAGNVVGGGDDSSGRLLPEVLSAIEKKSILSLRQPNSVRPWQHVLDCLFSYITWIERCTDTDTDTVKVLNFGPNSEDRLTVSDVLAIVQRQIGTQVPSRKVSSVPYPEQTFLSLDTSLSQSLGFSNIFDGPGSVESAVSWFQETENGVSPKLVTMQQIRQYLKLRAI